jgi:hypothetical protein
LEGRAQRQRGGCFVDEEIAIVVAAVADFLGVRIHVAEGVIAVLPGSAVARV